jgi:hypothetical protein
LPKARKPGSLPSQPIDVTAVVHAHAEDTLPFGIAQETKLRPKMSKSPIGWRLVTSAPIR